MARNRLLYPLLLGLLSAPGCGLLSGPKDDGAGWSVVPLEQAVKDAYSDFGFTLFRTLHSASPDRNIFFSPTSAAIALAMTYPGAAGETAMEISEVLGVRHLPPHSVAETNRDWIRALVETGDLRATLAIANSTSNPQKNSRSYQGHRR